MTESISLTDLVQLQLRIAQGCDIEEAGLQQLSSSVLPPALHSLQLRITAEDVAKSWSLSVGKIQSFHFPSGNGVRVDTSLLQGTPAIVGSDFDSLIAKMIVTAPSWDGVLRKAKRALQDTRITGVQTNLHLLQAILAHEDFAAGECDTAWLERNHTALLSASRRIAQHQAEAHSSQDLVAFKPAPTAATAALSTLATASSSSAPLLFRKGDAWTLSLQPKAAAAQSSDSTATTTALSDPISKKSKNNNNHHLEITKVSRNDFPRTLAAEISLTPLSDATTITSTPTPYTLHLTSSSSSSAHSSSDKKKQQQQHHHNKQGSPTDPSHVLIPFPGKLVEVCVDVGDAIEAGAVVCVVRQMKMELEVRCKKGGVVGWVIGCDEDDVNDEDNDDGEVEMEVGEGVLAAVVVSDDKVEEKKIRKEKEKAKL